VPVARRVLKDAEDGARPARALRNRGASAALDVAAVSREAPDEAGTGTQGTDPVAAGGPENTRRSGGPVRGALRRRPIGYLPITRNGAALSFQPIERDARRPETLAQLTPGVHEPKVDDAVPGMPYVLGSPLRIG
jgi:hypothetical protein